MSLKLLILFSSIIFPINSQFVRQILVQILWRDHPTDFFSFLSHLPPKNRFILELESLVFGHKFQMEMATQNYDVAIFDFTELANLFGNLDGMESNLTIRVNGRGTKLERMILREGLKIEGVDKIVTFSFAFNEFVEQIPSNPQNSLAKIFPERILEFVLRSKWRLMRPKIQCRINGQIIYSIDFLSKGIYSLARKMTVCAGDEYSFAFWVGTDFVDAISMDCGEAIHAPNLSNVYFVELKGDPLEPLKYSAHCAPLNEEGWGPKAIGQNILEENEKMQRIFTEEEEGKRQMEEMRREESRQLFDILGMHNSEGGKGYFQREMEKTRNNFREFQSLPRINFKLSPFSLADNEEYLKENEAIKKEEEIPNLPMTSSANLAHIPPIHFLNPPPYNVQIPPIPIFTSNHQGQAGHSQNRAKDKGKGPMAPQSEPIPPSEGNQKMEEEKALAFLHSAFYEHLANSKTNLGPHFDGHRQQKIGKKIQKTKKNKFSKGSGSKNEEIQKYLNKNEIWPSQNKPSAGNNSEKDLIFEQHFPEEIMPPFNLPSPENLNQIFEPPSSDNQDKIGKQQKNV